jgi:hypothetical protein
VSDQFYAPASLHPKKEHPVRTQTFRTFWEQSRGKAIPIQGWTGTSGFRKLRIPEFIDNWHLKVVGISALRTGRLYLVLVSVTGSVDPSGHSAAGRVHLTKNPNDHIGNRTRDLPACSATVYPTFWEQKNILSLAII